MVLLTVVAFSWLFGGLRPAPLLAVMPWVWAFAFEAMLFFPQRRPYEDMVSARQRTLRGLRRDPLLYFVVAFLVLLSIPFLNVGLCQSCDYPSILAGHDPSPTLPFLPFCVNVREHLGVFIWFLPAFTAMLAARHALIRNGKRALVEAMAWNAAALAVLGFIQIATKAQGPFWTRLLSLDWNSPTYFFSAFGYPNVGGSFFILGMAMSIGCWLTHAAETAAISVKEVTNGQGERFLGRFIRSHYCLVAAMLNFFGALNTMSRAAIILTLSTAALAFAYFEVSLLFARKQRVRRFKNAAYAAGGAMVLLVIAFVFAPDNLTRELNTLTSTGILDRVSGKAQYHVRVSTSIMKDYPFFGVGGWGYRHFALQYMRDDELAQMQKEGGANVHNDYMQFIVEHGLVGVALLLMALLSLLIPILRDWYLLYRAARFTKSDKAPPTPRGLYCLPPGTFWILVGCACVLIHAFGDCPFRSGAVLSTFFVALACADGFIPRDIGSGGGR